MTFSVLARRRDGAVGMAVTSSSPAVAARCVHLRAGVGGASSQNITDPRLGAALLDALERGLTPEKALAEVVATTEDVEYRQLTVIDLHVVSQRSSRGSTRSAWWVSDAAGPSSPPGNMLASPAVIDAVADAFERSSATSSCACWRRSRRGWGRGRGRTAAVGRTVRGP